MGVVGVADDVAYPLLVLAAEILVIGDCRHPPNETEVNRGECGNIRVTVELSAHRSSASPMSSVQEMAARISPSNMHLIEQINEICSFPVATVLFLLPDWNTVLQEERNKSEALISLLLNSHLTTLRQLAEKDKQLAAKDEQLAAKDKQLAEKDERIYEMMTEASDNMTNLVANVSNSRPLVNRWGTYTRTEMWNRLFNDGRVRTDPALATQTHPKKGELQSKLQPLEGKTWADETDMYSPVIDAIQSTLYGPPSSICVIKSAYKSNFRPDVSIADFDGELFATCSRYFIELKVSSRSLNTAGHHGQILEYFIKARENQLFRTEFVAILSNLKQTWVFTASFTNPTSRDRFSSSDVALVQRQAPTFADAIIYADTISSVQYRQQLPSIDPQFVSNCEVLAMSRKHTLFKAELRIPATSVATTAVRTRSQMTVSPENNSPLAPQRHTSYQFFALKMAHEGYSLANEIEILKKIQCTDCIHLPELVWSPPGDRQLGIVPVGLPVETAKTLAVRRGVVRGLVDGLQHLHGLGIVHRDIRPANLVLSIPSNQLVIIDYETSVAINDPKVVVSYEGGYVCWPKRLLESGDELYTPEPADDLLACILVVLHLIFPSSFETFRANERPNLGTTHLLTLWSHIEESKIWGGFWLAAKEIRYKELRDMADIFCHF